MDGALSFLTGFLIENEFSVCIDIMSEFYCTCQPTSFPELNRIFSSKYM